jgi:1,2-diacylglycerol-3-alpha-glucose alpha-1,2-galactosyltransferase
MKKLKVNIVWEWQKLWPAQGINSAFLTTVAMLKKSPDVEIHINSLKTCDIMHAQYPGPIYYSLMSVYRGRRMITAHVVPESFYQGVAPWLTPSISRVVLSFFNTADLLVAVAPGVRRNLQSRGVRPPQVVIPNAIDLSSFRPDPELRARGRAILGVPSHAKVVLGVGIMCLRKGIDDFVEVARANPHLTFAWIGGATFSLFTDGYFKQRDWAAAAPRNLLLPGILPYEKMPALYNAADLMFLPTRQETFGLVVAEAAACGLPLVLRDLENFRELFADAYLGANRPVGFSDCIRGIFSSPAEAARMVEKSFALARQYDSRALAARLVETYQALYERHRQKKLRAA